MTLTWLVADSLTGRLVGRLAPSQWEWVDPLTGSAEGSLTIPLVRDVDEVAKLRTLLVPHDRQIVAVDEQHRCWFGGPVMAEPERSDDSIVVTTADWRAWFYGAAIRPLSDTLRRDYIHVDPPIEQNQAIADLAAIALDTIGKPALVVDTPADSGITREVSQRMFAMTGDAMDDIARRDGAPDWWVYMTYADSTRMTVVGHVAVGWPERNTATTPLLMRHVRSLALRSSIGQGGNVLTVTWPRGNVPPSRVFGVGSTPPPGEEWATAENPDLTDGMRLAWDEVWQLPDGVNSAETSYEQAVARLDAHTQAMSAVELSLDVDATDLGGWGPGDRTRLVIDDGWNSVDLDDRRILARTLRGRGEHVTECVVTVNLTNNEQDIDDPPEEDSTEE